MLDLSSSHWDRALVEGLGATVSHMPGGGSIACFRAGPFRIAYPDFAIGSSDCNRDLDVVIHAAKDLRADMLRLQSPCACEDSRTRAVHPLGTIVIGDLQGWNEWQREKPRRAANRERRSELSIRKGVSGDGRHLHALYLATVRRHGGAARYTERYFELIAPYASIVAEHEGAICGFVCVGFRGARGYYLHGAHDPETRGLYPSDQLFLAMLREARDAGLRSFDFLPTPLGQASLSAYKHAWGGVDEPLVVSDVALNPWRARGIAVAMRAERALHRLISR